MIELGRRCETSKYAVEPPEKLFGRLIAMELIAITLSEALVNAENYPHVRKQLMELYTKREETIEVQISNCSEDKVARLARRNKKACVNAFMDSLNQFIDYGDENLVD